MLKVANHRKILQLCLVSFRMETKIGVHLMVGTKGLNRGQLLQFGLISSDKLSGRSRLAIRFIGLGNLVAYKTNDKFTLTIQVLSGCRIRGFYNRTGFAEIDSLKI